MQYLMQATLTELQAAASSWGDEGGDRYVAKYEAGWASIAGPLMAGNPNLPWFEIQVTDIAILDALGVPYDLMKKEIRKPGHLRGAYKASIASSANSRSLIRDSGGRVVGVTPNFTICGTNPAANFLAGEDPDDAEEITGLE